MDLSSIDNYLRPANIHNLPEWDSGYSWLAGGTWLFSEVQPDVSTLVDLADFGWSEIEWDENYLNIGATCKLVDLLNYDWLPKWNATSGFQSAISALAASIKVVNMATIGGNICLALSVGTLAPLMVALDAKYELWDLQGKSRHIAAKDFQIAARQTVLQPGEVLRRILIPVENLTWHLDYQKFSLAAADPAIAIAVTTCNPQKTQIRSVIAASVSAPSIRQICRESNLQPQERDAIANICTSFANENYLDDYKASSNYRRAMTANLIARSLQRILVLKT